MKKIDINQLERKQQFMFFKDLDVPQYQITTMIDVTNFRRYVKETKKSFYLSFIHSLLKVLNRHECFKYRFINNDVFLFDQVNPSFTDQIQSSEQFKIVTCDYLDDLDRFIALAKKTSYTQGSNFIDMTEEIRKDLVYITTVPWYSFTQVTHAHMIDSKDAIPKICFGKYVFKAEAYEMPLSIEVHHAFVDGYHLGIFFDDLQQYLNTL